MRIALGCDHAGYLLKEEVKSHLKLRELSVFDFGTFDETSIDYPDISFAVAKNISEGTFDLGILICGTGVGVSIAANKVPGIRAALCGDTFTARAAREHNNANILALGARVVGSGLALDIVDAFLGSKFAGQRHSGRVGKIELLEKGLAGHINICPGVEREEQ